VNGIPDESPTAVDFGGEIFFDEKRIPGRFNEFYIKSIKDINESISEETDIDSFTNESASDYGIFALQVVSIANIFQALRGIISKSDSQFLNKNVLIDAMSVIGNQILNVINCSLTSGICSERDSNGMEKVSRERKNGETTVAVFLDLKRAFETICRQRLIMKLERIGITGKEKDWKRSE